MTSYFKMADEEETKVNFQPDGSKVDLDDHDFGSSVDSPASLNLHNNRLTGVDGPSSELEHFDDHDAGSGVDSPESLILNNRLMGVDSPSSELENLTGDVSESDNDMTKSVESGMYEMNPEKTDQNMTENKENESVFSYVNSNENSDTNAGSGTNENSDTNAGSETSETKEKIAKTNRRLTDSFHSTQSKSGRTSPRLNTSLPSSRPASAASSSKSGPKDEKDPAKKEKERQREEQIRLRQVQLVEERQRKIEEMKEQQRQAQEKREKQLEARRKKIEESKRKDAERRKEVEERRLHYEMLDKAKLDAILSKAKERLTLYDDWRINGRKGFPFGYSPPSKKLSKSTSVLYRKDSPEHSSTGMLHTSPSSGGLKSGAESMMASAPPSRHKSVVNLGSSFTGVKKRDPSKSTPRKPRPSSVATSMPSFVKIDMSDSPKSSRSKSTERGTREHSRTRVPGHKDGDKTEEKKAATLPRPYDRKKIEERRQDIKRKNGEKKEKEVEKQERMTKSDIQVDKSDKPQVRMSRSFIERMSVPKRASPDKKEVAAKESPSVKVAKRAGSVEAPRASNQKAKASPKEKPKALPDSPSKSALKTCMKDTKAKDDSSSTRSESPKSVSPAPSGTPPARRTPTIQGEEDKGLDETDSPDISFDESSREHSAPSQPTVTFAEPERISSPRHKPAETKAISPEPKAKAEPKAEPKAAEAKPKTDKEREMEEYKAKLAEKRRLAREKAEREAEIERLKQEEEERKEEERQRLEEERQRKEEEEAMRLAEESRKAEEERLQKAIEAEERRKKEEAERMELERIAKEEADRKAKEEAERLEKERQERAKREEEERVERKKRLEMIMKRVKTGDTPSTPEKRNESPTRVVTSSSSRTSLVSSEDERGDDSEKDEGSDGGLKPEEAQSHKFKSPLLQKLTETKQNGDSGTPKFKSPLLQSIMGKTKLGSRLSGSKLNLMGKSDENLAKSDDETLARSDDNLSENERDKTDEESEQIVKIDTTTTTTTTTNKEEDNSNGINVTVSSMDNECETEASLLKEESRVDVDSHELSGETVIEGADIKQSGSDLGVTDSQLTVGSTGDSAVSLSFNGVSSQNGDVHIEELGELIDSKELVDSSISMRTADSFGSSQTGSMGGSLVESQTVTASDSSQFEEIIDLNVTNKTLKTQQFTDNLLNHSEDLLNLNNIPVDSLDNNHMTAGGDADSRPIGKPFIAFEENATRRQDVTDLTS